MHELFEKYGFSENKCDTSIKYFALLEILEYQKVALR